jgi:hypothetical protein
MANASKMVFGALDLGTSECFSRTSHGFVLPPPWLTAEVLLGPRSVHTQGQEGPIPGDAHTLQV